MSARKRVTVDGELLLNRLEAAERAIANIRKMVLDDLPQPGSPAGININLIEWKTKGNEPAREDDSWAWAFSRTHDGVIRDETRQLVGEIERYGKVEVGGYVITLGGRDKRLLSRNKVRTKSG